VVDSEGAVRLLVAQTSVCGVPLELGCRIILGWRGRPGFTDGTPQTEVCATGATRGKYALARL
jgi:hypothetical protein